MPTVAVDHDIHIIADSGTNGCHRPLCELVGGDTVQGFCGWREQHLNRRMASGDDLQCAIDEYLRITMALRLIDSAHIAAAQVRVQPQHMDIFAGGLLAQARLQQGPPIGEALRQLPAGQRRGLVQSPALTFQQRKIVQPISTRCTSPFTSTLR
jgi:hypothetical protein